MRVVLDTNQYVSALIRRGGVQDRLLDEWYEGSFEVAISPVLVAEVSEVLDRQRIRETYRLTPAAIATFLAILHAQAELVPGDVTVSVVAAEPADDAVLACALEAQADYVITGDRHLLELGSYQSIPIVTAATFVELLARHDAP